MDRYKLLAAEIYGYSYYDYERRYGDLEFDTLLPEHVRSVERAERFGMSDEELAREIEMQPANVAEMKIAYNRAKPIIDAPDPAEGFRRGVRHSIWHAMKEGLNTAEDVEKLVSRICVRASNLGYLLKREGKDLSDYSGELEKKPGGG